MGITDKAKNTADEFVGRVKEKTGQAKDDRDLETEGQADQSKANLKQAGENVKDAFKS